MDPIKVDISNDGFTQALNVRAYGGVVAIESRTPPPMEKMRNLAIPTMIKADTPPITGELNFVDGIVPATKEDVPEMFFLYAFGRITYEDFIGKVYEEVFGYRLQMSRVDEDERAIGILGWERYDPPTSDKSK